MSTAVPEARTSPRNSRGRGSRTDPQFRGDLLRPRRPDSQWLVALDRREHPGRCHLIAARSRRCRRQRDARWSRAVAHRLRVIRLRRRRSPAGDHDHRYFFAVHALDVDTLDLTPDTPAAIAGFNLTAHDRSRRAGCHLRALRLRRPDPIAASLRPGTDPSPRTVQHPVRGGPRLRR